MLDSLHTARHVTKVDASRIDAFASPATGPAGVLVEDRVRLHMFPERRWRDGLSSIFPKTDFATLQSNPKQVGLVTGVTPATTPTGSARAASTVSSPTPLPNVFS